MANFSAYVAPITGEKSNKALFGNSWQLAQKLEEIKREFSSASILDTQDTGLLGVARRIFSGGGEDAPFEMHKSSFCGAHTGMYLFDPLCDIYACWERTGDSKVRIGNIGDDGALETNDAFESKWRSRTVTTNEHCANCRYALHCGGGCAIMAEAQAGGFFSNHCDGYASRFRSTISRAYIEHVANA